MKFGKRIMLITIALAISGQFSALSANDPIDQLIISEAKPFVSTTLDGIFVEAPFVSNMIVMNVLVYNGQNELVLNVRSKGEPAELLAAGLPDGEYHYQATTIFQLDYPVGEGANYEDQGSSRQSGSFTVINGEISQDMQSISKEILESKEQSSLIDRIIDHAVNLAGVALDVLVPSAHAQDVLASSTFPTVFWNDTTFANTGSEFASSVALNSATVGTWGVFDIIGASNANLVMTITGVDGSSLNSNAFNVDADGDLHWGDYFMHLDKGAGALSLGWASTPTDFSINATTPDILLHDSSANSDSEWQLQDNTAVFWGRASGGGWNSVMTYRVEAPSNSLSIASNGDVGIGTFNPSASQHLTRSDKTAQLKVTDTSATIGNLNLLQLENAGGAQVGFNDTTRAYQWNFIGGRDFKINATTFAGTEFVVTTAGNLDILGILTENSDENSKQDIEPVDGQNILEKLKNLKIAEWSYKDTPADRHVGPMAQDFFAAFGLGHTDTGIATLDSSGIALAAIKALIEENQSLEQHAKSMEQRVIELEQQNQRIEELVMRLVSNQAEQVAVN